jgi:MFS family permease
VIGLCLFASTVPSPLYHTYATAWHFSSLTLTLVYATYAFGVLAALLLAGRVSDQVGRRPVLLVALAALMVSAALFIAADATWWLFVARGVQGLATGTALSAASAALLDLHPRRDPVSVGLANAVASCAGLGLGVLVSAALVQAGTAPRTLPYLTLLVLFGTALAGAYWMPEPVRERSAFRLTPQRPGVPAGIGHPFLVASLAVLSAWSIGGLRQLTSVIPAEHRAAVMSAFYLVGYASLSVPAVVAGLVVTHVGLETTFEIFGSIVAGIALVMAVEAWRMRPRVTDPR